MSEPLWKQGKWTVNQLVSLYSSTPETIKKIIDQNQLESLTSGKVKSYNLQEFQRCWTQFHVDKALKKATGTVNPSGLAEGDLDAKLKAEKLRLTQEQADKLAIQNGEAREEQIAKVDVKKSLQQLLQSLASGIDDLTAGIKSASPEWNNKALRELEKWRIDSKATLVSFRVREDNQ